MAAALSIVAMWVVISVVVVVDIPAVWHNQRRQALLLEDSLVIGYLSFFFLQQSRNLADFVLQSGGAELEVTQLTAGRRVFCAKENVRIINLIYGIKCAHERESPGTQLF